jgi:DNA-binding SARP family transcriptional activator/TolB-like protein
MEARHALGQEWVETEGELVGLSFRDDLWLDVRQLNGLLERLENKQGGAGRGELAQLKEVVDLYRSDFLSGFNLDSNSTFSEWQLFQTEGLRKRIIAILDRLVEAHARSGEQGVAIAYARRRLAIDPADETAHRRLMRLYGVTGQFNLAIRQYNDCRRKLERDLGVEPDEKTEQLYRDVVARRPVAALDPHEVEGGAQSLRAPASRPGRAAAGRLRVFLGSRLGVAVICTAALLAVGAGVLATVSAVAAARPKTIAVFPIVVHSADGARESFGLGMADALVAELTGLPRLEVRVGGTLPADERGDAASRSAQAAAIGVAFYVEGSVFQVGEQVQVFLRLLAAGQGTVLWSHAYGPSLFDPLALQTEIAADARVNIAETLRLR